MTVSFLPLIRAQQKPHSPVHRDRTFDSAKDILNAGQQARDRLRGGAVPAPTVKAIIPPAKPVEEAPTGFVPLNMLMPCSWKFILAYVALSSDVSQKEILGADRSRRVVAARHRAMALTYQHTQSSLPGVGRLFGKDHTTVLHALSKFGMRGKLAEMLPETEALSRPKKGPKLPPRSEDPFTPRTALQKAVARAYKHGVPTQALVEAYGTTTRSVNVIAHNLGLTRKPKVNEAQK